MTLVVLAVFAEFEAVELAQRLLDIGFALGDSGRVGESPLIRVILPLDGRSKHCACEREHRSTRE